MKLLHGIAITLLFSSAAYAHQDIELNGTTKYPLTNTKTSSKSVKFSDSPKYIRLLNINLSDKAWKKLDKPIIPSSMSTALATSRKHLPTQVQLGMDQVPVLDQGPYGTCVMFAVTAAVDAASNHGDYISQLCQLELGQYLENNTGGTVLSGWNGSLGKMVLNQMDSFGFVSKDIERSIGCGGLTAYPSDGVIPENELNLSESRKISTDMSDDTVNVGWSSLMDFYQAFVDDIDREQVLIDVKDSLNNGDRLTFGVLLFAPQLGVVGAVGKHKVSNDSWIITPLINGLIKAHDIHGEHDMIITGYDDDAIATDEKGQTYKGLLTLRNSWGKNAGDAGNFYMSYDYFKRLGVEVQRIRQL